MSRTKKNKPTISFDSQVIPKELQKLRQWITFKFEWNESKEKWNKVPYQLNDTKASPVNSNHWTDFFNASFECYLVDEKFDGLGFVFSKSDPYVGIDLDNCVDSKTKKIEFWAQEIIEQFNGTYIEFSPSGTGIHIISRGTLPNNEGKRKDQIEIYNHGRYFTVSSDIISCPKVITNKQNQITALLNQILENDDTKIDLTSELKGKELNVNVCAKTFL